MNVAFDIDKTLLTLDGQLIENIYQLFRKLSREGHNIYLITARYPYQDFTKKQLGNLGLGDYMDLDNNIYYTSGRSKVPVLRDLKISLFFDDLADNIVDIINNLHVLEKNFKLFQIIYVDGNYRFFDTNNKNVYY